MGFALRQFWIYRSSLRHRGLRLLLHVGHACKRQKFNLIRFCDAFLLPVQSADTNFVKSQPPRKTLNLSDFFRLFFETNVEIWEKKLKMKKALRRVQRSLSRDRFGGKKNPRSSSQESIDSNLTNKSQPTRPPSELSQVIEGLKIKKKCSKIGKWSSTS